MREGFLSNCRLPLLETKDLVCPVQVRSVFFCCVVACHCCVGVVLLVLCRCCVIGVGCVVGIMSSLVLMLVLYYCGFVCYCYLLLVLFVIGVMLLVTCCLHVVLLRFLLGLRGCMSWDGRFTINMIGSHVYRPVKPKNATRRQARR